MIKKLEIYQKKEYQSICNIDEYNRYISIVKYNIIFPLDQNSIESVIFDINKIYDINGLSILRRYISPLLDNSAYRDVFKMDIVEFLIKNKNKNSNDFKNTFTESYEKYLNEL